MTRQIQIRRGTATENDAFTGAVGEVTMDTTNNTLRIHDGTTPGGTVLAKKSEIPSQQITISPIPDWSAGVDITPPTSSSKYTCPYDGIYCFCLMGNQTKTSLYINDIKTANCMNNSTTANANKTTVSVYLNKSDIIYFDGIISSIYSSTFYPLMEA